MRLFYNALSAQKVLLCYKLCTPNSIVFDTTTGSILNYDFPHDPQPPLVLLAPLITEPDFPYVAGDFPRRGRGEWSEEEALSVGRMIVNTLADDQASAPILTHEAFHRLDILGVLPGYNYLKRHFGSISEYRHHIGAGRPRNSSDYDSFTKQKLLHHLKGVFEETGAKPPVSVEAIQVLALSDMIPSYTYLYNRFGGVRAINEAFGFPDFTAWDGHDMINFGADFIKMYGSSALSVRSFEKLSRERQAPYRQLIYKYFPSWKDFRNAAETEARLRDEKRKELNAAIASHFHKVVYDQTQELDLRQKERIFAVHCLCKAFLPNLPEKELAKLSLCPDDGFVKAIMKHKPTTSPALIEIEAETLGLSDILWPPTHHTLTVDIDTEM